MDKSVGVIFEALEKSDMLDDTIFIFISDNGGIPQGEKGTSGSNWPLKGCKGTVWEGGVRGVSFVWSPTLRQHSRIHNGLMHITDWLPTVLAMAGKNCPKSKYYYHITDSLHKDFISRVKLLLT